MERVPVWSAETRVGLRLRVKSSKKANFFEANFKESAEKVKRFPLSG